MSRSIPPLEWLQQVATFYAGALHGYELLAGYNHYVFRLRTQVGTRILKVAKHPHALTLDHELQMYRSLASTRIPTADLLHADLAGKQFGRPLLILADAGPENLAQAAARADNCELYRALAQTLAEIHHVPWDALNPPPEPTALQAISPQAHAAVPSVKRPANEQSVRLQRATEWALRQRYLTRDELAPLHEPLLKMAEAVPGKSLCHGDFHAHQCIVADGKITAVTDWHAAHPGTARSEFVRALTTISMYTTPAACEAFAAQYAKLTQTAAGIASEAERFWALAQCLAILHAAHRQQNEQQRLRAIEQYRRMLRQTLLSAPRNE